jgi:hypothetical protein
MTAAQSDAFVVAVKGGQKLRDVALLGHRAPLFPKPPGNLATPERIVAFHRGGDRKPPAERSDDMFRTASLGLVLAMVANVSAETLHVPGDFPAIQDAIGATVDGDEIIVAPGTYFEAINFLGRAITLRSSDGPDLTIINGTGNFHVVQCVSGEGPETVLDGFTITGGHADGSYPDNRGGGMYNVGSSPTVINCTFSGNTAYDGGGMYNLDSNPALDNCTFLWNSATGSFYGRGGGMYNAGSSPIVAGCAFSFNMAYGGVFGYGGGMYNAGGSPTVTDCTFSANTASGGGFDGSGFGGFCGGMYNNDSSPVVTNCTFSGNAADECGGMYNAGGSPAVTDCTFTDNSAHGAGGMYNSGGSPTVTNCTFSGNSAGWRGGGMRNIGGNPTVTNCTFIGNSATYGGGGMVNENSNPTVIDCTFSGNTTGSSGTYAHGGAVYNWNSTPLLSNCIFDANSGNRGGAVYNDRSDPTLTGCVFTGNAAAIAGGAMYTLESFYGVPTITDSSFCDSSPNHVAGDYNDGGENDFCPLCDEAAGTLLAVPATYPTIQDALAAACDGAEIIVAPGTYAGLINFGGKAVTLRSSDGPEVTTIDGQGMSPVVVAANHEGPGAVLDGFTVRNGSIGMHIEESSPTVTNSTFEADDRGMSIDNGSPTISNCVFDGHDFSGMTISGGSPSIVGCTFSNNSYNTCGGGISSSGSASIVGCTFVGNSTSCGGGMKIAGEGSSVIDSTFVGNTAVNGAGLLISDGVAVINCTFMGNVASGVGGGIDTTDFSSPTVTGCLFVGNAAQRGGGMMSGAVDTAVTNCTFVGNTASIDTTGGLGGGATVANCILWGNTPNGVSAFATIAYSNVQGGFPGVGNMDGDPLFVDPDNGDFRLSPGSPCIDAGHNNAIVNLTDADLDGNPRFADDPDTPDTGCGVPVVVDMGAHEYQGNPGDVTLADLDGDNVVGVDDFGALMDCWSSSDEPCCLADLDLDGIVGVVDFLILLANWS